MPFFSIPGGRLSYWFVVLYHTMKYAHAHANASIHYYAFLPSNVSWQFSLLKQTSLILGRESHDLDLS